MSSVIVHAHLEPNHPAVLAKRAIQARQKAQMEAKLARDRKVASDALASQEARRMAHEAYLARLEAARSEEEKAREREAIETKAREHEAKLSEIVRIGGLQVFNQSTRVKQIVNDVSERTGISVNDLVSNIRSFSVVLARHEAMATIAKELSMSLPAIGRVFLRDHTTVIYAIRNWNERTGQNIRNLGNKGRKQELARLAYIARKARAE
jgi:chromosomal replication initiation ATPase DnaA